MKPTLLIIAGAVAVLVIMVLTHIAETYSLVPQMGWGRPDTPGHYVDLVSAIAGLALVLAGVSLRAIGIGRRTA